VRLLSETPQARNGRQAQPVSQRLRLHELTPQQTSLVRSVLFGDVEYLNRSFWLDPDTGKRGIHPLRIHELSSFARSWALAPIPCIRLMNDAIARITEASRVSRYLGAAVDLEILMDRAVTGDADAKLSHGIPSYLADGYIDMGSRSSFTQRQGREKIRVDKDRLRARLVDAKRQAVESVASRNRNRVSLEKLLARYYDVVRREIAYDERGVRTLYEELGDRTIDLSNYMREGVGVCRHLSILYQLCLQEAGIYSSVVKGDMRLFGFKERHAWNVAPFQGEIALIDITLPNGAGPFILVGESLQDINLKAAATYHRAYVPTPDSRNHYRIQTTARV